MTFSPNVMVSFDEQVRFSIHFLTNVVVNLIKKASKFWLPSMFYVVGIVGIDKSK